MTFFSTLTFYSQMTLLILTIRLLHHYVWYMRHEHWTHSSLVFWVTSIRFQKKKRIHRLTEIRTSLARTAGIIEIHTQIYSYRYILYTFMRKFRERNWKFSKVFSYIKSGARAFLKPNMHTEKVDVFYHML